MPQVIIISVLQYYESLSLSCPWRHFKLYNNERSLTLFYCVFELKMHSGNVMGSIVAPLLKHHNLLVTGFLLLE